MLILRCFGGFHAATIDEARAYLFNMDPMLGASFCPAAVVDAEHLLGLRRKASSTTCMRVFLSLNEHMRYVFWITTILLVKRM